MKKGKQQCMNCEKPAVKAGMCGACYQRGHREKQQLKPEAVEKRKQEYRKERRRLSGEILNLIHRIKNLDEKNGLSSLVGLAAFKVSLNNFFDELKADDEEQTL